FVSAPNRTAISKTITRNAGNETIGMRPTTIGHAHEPPAASRRPSAPPATAPVSVERPMRLIGRSIAATSSGKGAGIAARTSIPSARSARTACAASETSPNTPSTPGSRGMDGLRGERRVGRVPDLLLELGDGDGRQELEEDEEPGEEPTEGADRDPHLDQGRPVRAPVERDPVVRERGDDDVEPLQPHAHVHQDPR